MPFLLLSPQIHYLAERLAADNIVHVVLSAYKALLLIEASGSVVILQHPQKNLPVAKKFKLFNTSLHKLRADTSADILGQQINSNYLAAAAEILPTGRAKACRAYNFVPVKGTYLSPAVFEDMMTLCEIFQSYPL